KISGSGLRLLYPLHGLGSDYLLDVRLFEPVVDYAVSTSRLAAAGLRRIAGLPEERVSAIRFGVEPPSGPVRVRKPRAPLELGYVGRLSQPEKRVRDLVPLCEGLRRRGLDFRLRIAGSGEEEAFLRG